MLIPMLVSAWLAGGAPAPAAQAPPEWRQPARGLEVAMMDGGKACRRGSRAIAVVRFDPDRWRIDVFHRTEDPAAGALDVEGWRRRTGAAVAFNAGQYYPGGAHMGLFVKDGRNIGSRELSAWKAILLAEPGDGARVPRAMILDKDHEAFDAATTPYRVAVQSFMLIDRDGDKRVRRSDREANRTVVAQDRRGRLLVMHTEGACTLWELADWISRSGLGVSHAMSLDGGFEAQISVAAGGFEYTSFGQWHVDERGDHSIAGARRTLPAVIGLFPRQEDAGDGGRR